MNENELIEAAKRTFELVPEIYAEILEENPEVNFPDGMVEMVKKDPRVAEEILSDEVIADSVIKAFAENQEEIMQYAQQAFAEKQASAAQSGELGYPEFKKGGKLDQGLRIMQMGGYISRRDALDEAMKVHGYKDRASARLAYINAKKALRENSDLRGRELRQQARANIMRDDRAIDRNQYAPITSVSIPASVQSYNEGLMAPIAPPIPTAPADIIRVARVERTTTPARKRSTQPLPPTVEWNVVDKWNDAWNRIVGPAKENIAFNAALENDINRNIYNEDSLLRYQINNEADALANDILAADQANLNKQNVVNRQVDAANAIARDRANYSTMPEDYNEGTYYTPRGIFKPGQERTYRVKTPAEIAAEKRASAQAAARRRPVLVLKPGQPNGPAEASTFKKGGQLKKSYKK